MEKITRKNNCPNTNRRYKNPSPDTNKSLLYTSNIYKREKEKYQIYTSILRKYKYRTNKYFKRHFQQEKKKKRKYSNPKIETQKYISSSPSSFNYIPFNPFPSMDFKIVSRDRKKLSRLIRSNYIMSTLNEIVKRNRHRTVCRQL